MPRSKEGKTRAPLDPEVVKNALQAITTDDPEKKLSIREAEKVFKVSRATLTRQLKKYKEDNEKYCYSVNCAVKQIFSSDEEDSLVEYIINVAHMKYGLTKKGVRLLALKFAKANNKSLPLNSETDSIAGEEWMRGFLKRHSDKLSIRTPEATSLSRCTSFNRHNVQLFYNNLKDVHARFGPISPDKIWNMDETGMTTVQGQSKIVAPKGAKQVGSATSAERGALVTMLKAVNAVGNAISPMLIFPRVHLKERMLFGGPAGCIGTANPTGWSNEAAFLKFLDHFLSFVKCSREDRAILVLDNHETHLSPEALDKASNNGLVMITFPPHTSHKLQPLDISVYGPLKCYYNQAVEAWLLNNKGKTFDIYTVSEALGTAFPRAFTPSNIMSGFRKAGIFPFDESIFTDSDFLSSYVTDQPLNSEDTAPVPGTPGEAQPSTSSESTSIPESSFQPVNSTTPLDDLASGSSCSSAVAPQGSSTATPFFSSSPKSSSVTPQTKGERKQFVSPEEVQPYPKAERRKTSKGGRKRGRTMIATDTPEKNAIKEQKLKSKKNPKTASKSASKNLKDLFDDKTKEQLSKKPDQEKKRVSKKRKYKEESSSSSEEETFPVVSTDNEDSDEEECIYCCNSKNNDSSGEKWCKCIRCGRWTHYLCAGVEGSQWKTYVCDFCVTKM